MGIHDPASPDDGDLVSQSPFTTDLYNVIEVLGPFADGYRTQSQPLGMGGNTAFLDEYFAITPLFGLAADQDQLIFLTPIQFTSWEKPVSQRYSSATGGRVLDVAIAPEGTRHPYLIEGDNNVWQIDRVTGQSSRLAAVDGPQRLTFGG